MLNNIKSVTHSLEKNTTFSLKVISLLLAAFAVTPLFILLYQATTTSSENWAWISRWNTLIIISRSVMLAISVALLSCFIAVPLAWLTTRTDLPLRKMWQILTVLPLVIPSYIGAYLFISAIGPKGLIFHQLDQIMDIQYFPNLYGFDGCLIILSLLNYPYVLLTVRGAINELDPSLEDAAHTLGFSKIKTFTGITLPLIKPAIISGAILVALYTLSDFGAVSILRYKTFTWSIYNQYNASFNQGTAAMLSSLLFLVASAFLFTEVILKGKGDYFRTSTGSARRQKVTELGNWRIPSFLFCALIVLCSLLIPVTILIYWLIRVSDTIVPFGQLIDSTFNSVLLSSSTAIAITILVIPVGILITSHRSIMSTWLERTYFTSYALPSIAVSLALVVVGIKLGKPIYQSHFILITGLIVLFLPTGLSPIKIALLQVNPLIKESALTLGRGYLHTTLTVTLPLIKRGLGMSFAIVFLVTMKELPAIMILSPLDFNTLTMSIWSYSTEAFFAQASIPALMLILISTAPLAIIMGFSSENLQGINYRTSDYD